MTPAAAIRSEDERLAYLLVRMPATFAALVQALREAKRQFMPQSGDALVCDNGVGSDDGMAMETVLDLGSGPGTAAWAVAEAFPDVRQFRLVERDRSLIGLGRQLCATSDLQALRQAEWIQADLNGKLAEECFRSGRRLVFARRTFTGPALPVLAAGMAKDTQAAGAG